MPPALTKIEDNRICRDARMKAHSFNARGVVAHPQDVDLANLKSWPKRMRSGPNGAERSKPGSRQRLRA